MNNGVRLTAGEPCAFFWFLDPLPTEMNKTMRLPGVHTGEGMRKAVPLARRNLLPADTSRKTSKLP